MNKAQYEILKNENIEMWSTPLSFEQGSDKEPHIIWDSEKETIIGHTLLTKEQANKLNYVK